MLDLLCGLVYLALAALLGARWRGRTHGLVLIGTCLATGVWCLLALGWRTGWLSREWAQPGELAMDVARLVGLIAFLTLLHREGARRLDAHWGTSWILVAGGALAAVLIALEITIDGGHGLDASYRLFQAAALGHLVLACGALVALEMLVRQSSPESLWRNKHVYIGLGAVMAFEVVCWSWSMVFLSPNTTLMASRGLLSLLVAPLLAVGAARNPSWSVEFYVSRRAVYHSVALAAVGAYALLLALLAGLQRTSGGISDALQMVIGASGFLLLILLFTSATVRSFARLQLDLYFFEGRYDYRDEWQRFVGALTKANSNAPLPDRVLRAVMHPMDIPQGAVWLIEDDVLRLHARVGLPQPPGELPAASLLPSLNELKGRPLVLAESAVAMQLPDWLTGLRSGWLLIPLLHRGVVIGFMVLTRPRVPRQLDFADRELLELLAAQAASYLAEDSATRTLEEAARFAAVSRRFAFVAHDLRNLASDLALTLSNARRHIQNPEFQEDLLETMEATISNMERLLTKVGKSDVRRLAPTTTDLGKLLRELPQVRLANRPAVQLEQRPGAELVVEGDRDRLTALCGHLIRNAVEASPADGLVRISVGVRSDELLLAIRDDGPGMRPEEARARMRRPFQSPKSNGYGLGLHECWSLARELGGGLAIETERGRGTLVQVSLPLKRDAVDGRTK
jgi:putative PEP-CTERM system histidine kinase